MNLASILISLIAKDEASGDINKVARAMLGMGQVSTQVATAIANLSKTMALVLVGAAAAIGAIIVAYKALSFGISTLHGAISASIEDAMKWEEAFAQVRKVLGAESGNDATKQLENDLIELSTRIPMAATELAKFAAIGAQMGIHQRDLALYAETIARISSSFDGATAEKMALSLGKIAAVTQMSIPELRNFASAIMLVGIKTAATEAQILQVIDKFAATAHIVGLSNDQIVGFAGSMASLNNRYMESGTAMNRMLLTFKQAAEEGGKKAQTFANAIGLPVDQFRKLAQEKPGETFQKFTVALGGTEKGAINTTKVLRELGFTGSRSATIFIAMANNTKDLQTNLKLAHDEMISGQAIINISNTRWDTAAKRMILLGNAVTGTSIEIGRTFLPALNLILTALEPIGQAVFELGRAFRVSFTDDLTETVRPATDVVRQFGDGLLILARAVDKFQVEHKDGGAAVKAFWNVAKIGIEGAATTAANAIPVLGSLLAVMQSIHDIGLAKGPQDSVTATSRLMPVDKKAIDEAAAATAAYLKMTEKLREELDKLGDLHRNTYQRMVADIERATQKELANARAIKGSKEEIAALEKQVIAVGEAKKKALAFDKLEGVMGPAIGEAAAKWEKLAGILKFAAENGIKPTREQLIQAAGDMKAFKEMSIATFASLETAMPGAYKELQEFFKGAREAAKMTADDWEDAFQQMLLSQKALRKEFERGPMLPGEGDMIGVGPTGDQRLAIARGELILRLQNDAAQLKLNASLAAYLLTLKNKKLISDEVYEKEIAGLTISTAKTFDWAKAITGVASAFQVLGIKADSTFGRILASISLAATAYKNLARDATGKVIPFANMTSNQKVESGTQAGLLAAATIINIYTASRDNNNTGSRVLGGAMQGAGTGAVIGTMIEPGGGTIAGAVIGAIVGAAIAFFSGPPWHKAAEEASKIFGFAVSKDLAKAIYADSQALGLTLASATLLHLGDAIKESGKPVAEFQKQIGQLMTGIADGSIPAVRGIAQISDAWGLAANEAKQSGDMISQTMLGMIMNTRALGIEVAAITAHIKENLTKAVAGVNALFIKRKDPTTGKAREDKGAPLLLDIHTETDAKAMAAIFNATFWGALKEFGLIAAVDSMKPAFDALYAQLEAAGFDVKTLFGGVLAFFQLAENEAFRGAAEAVVALKDTLVGLANAGMLTEEAYHAFGHAAVMAYEQARAGGATEKQGVMATLPLLFELQKAHDLYGYQLSEEEEKLMALAKANGVAFPKDPILQVRDAIYELIEAITGIPREVNINIHRHTTNTTSGPPDPGPFNNDGSHDYNGDPTDSFAFGGYVPYQSGGTTVKVAERVGEYMVPEDMMKTLMGKGGSGDGSPIHVHIHYPNGMIEEIVTAGSKSGTVRVFPDAVRSF